jgi:peptidoglycan hydrolase-like protein with peptidoglycan-binding domain
MLVPPTGPLRGLPRIVRIVTIVLILLALGATVGWAAATIFRPANDPAESNAFTYATVKQGEVGSTINLNTVATWTAEPAGNNEAAGIVTSVSIAPGAEMTPGSILFSVDLRPVVVAQGEVPAFRAISGGDHGQDVAQLQSMLQIRGFYHGAISGLAGSATVAAIGAWQISLGIPRTGVVNLGDLIFVPSLPTRGLLNTKVVARGLTLSGGEAALEALPPAPTFTMPVAAAQANVIPTGTSVEITSPEGDTWKAVVAGRSLSADQQTTTLKLSALGNGTICATQCSQVSVVGHALLDSSVVTVKTVKGLVVPTTALVTTKYGHTAVISATGKAFPVTVEASAQGLAVIVGVPNSTRVRLTAATN